MRAKFINEREDLEKYNLIKRCTSILIKKIKDYLLNVWPTEELQEDEDPGFFITPTFVFLIVMDIDDDDNFRGKYATKIEGGSGDNQIIIKWRPMCDLVNAIKDAPEDREYLISNFSWTSLSEIIFHEIVHRYDDLKYDINKVVNKKLARMKSNYVNDEFLELYYNSEAEHNAYFLGALNDLLRLVDNRALNIKGFSFEQFKSNFMGCTEFSDAVKGKWMKKWNKRIYDIYVKLKEQGKI